MTASGMVTYFEQVKKCWLFCWLWASQRIKPISELSWEKLDAWAFFGHHLMSVALHPGFSGLWKSPPALSSTLTRGFFLSFEYLGIQFFNLHLHVTYGMPCHTRGHSHSYLGKQKISLGVAITLLTYLAWLQPVYHNPKLVFVHVNTAKVLLLVKTLIKNIEQQPH